MNVIITWNVIVMKCDRGWLRVHKSIHRENLNAECNLVITNGKFMVLFSLGSKSWKESFSASALASISTLFRYFEEPNWIQICGKLVCLLCIVMT